MRNFISIKTLAIVISAILFISWIPVTSLAENVATLTFNNDLVSATYQLTDIATALDGSASTTDGGTITYQWYQVCDGLEEEKLEGETNSTFTPDITEIGTYSYKVVATSTIDDNSDSGTNSTTITSNTATITVVGKLENAQSIIVDGTISVDYGSDQDIIIAAVQKYVDGLLYNAAVDVSGVSAIVTYDSDNNYNVEITYNDEKVIKTITMNIQIGEDPNIETVAAANTAVQNATYSDVDQGVNFDTKEELEAYITEIATAAINDSSVAVKVEGKYTAATSGTYEDQDGTNGSYVFTITVSKGSQSKTTLTMSIAINATHYANYPITEVIGVALTSDLISSGIVSAEVALNTAQAISFRIDVDFSTFICLYIQDVIVDTAFYTAEPGSIIITLLPEYVQSLPVGSYEFTTVCTDGASTFKLVVADTPSTNTTNTDTTNTNTTSTNTTSTEDAAVQTGDVTNVWIWIVLTMSSIAGGAFIISNYYKLATKRKVYKIR